MSPESLSTRIRDGLRVELRPMLRLAVPVATSELGWMAMGLVDTMMVGRVSAAAIGAVGIGGNLFFTVAIIGIGMLLGLDFLVARAFGAGRLDEARRALVHGLYLALALSLVLSAVLFIIAARLEWLGLQPAVVADARAYLHALVWSLTPLLLYTALRRYLQALGLVRAVMVALVSANLINALVCWLLIFGHGGLPALGAEGAGWATCASRAYMLIFLLLYTLRHEQRAGTVWRGLARFEAARVREIVRLGLPSALQTLLEVGVFAAATLLAGRLAADQLAAHQVALSAASFTFMVPLGISSAAAVRVGRAVGRADAAAAARAGWTALLLGVTFMSASALLFIVAARPIIRVFTIEPAVIATGAALLGVAAIFQLFDGVQVVATGALRGSGNTRTAMFANLVGHWAIGLPIGYLLCFRYGWGVLGLWTGLCIGLISVSVVLIAAWRARTHALVIDFPRG